MTALSTLFGDSWRTQQTCALAQEPPNACVYHKERAPWAHKQCNVLNKDLFKPCHLSVNPKPYFDACFLDACSCDLGGDTECLCTAISAYATECSKQGVHIRWRSQELCRMFLSSRSIYSSGPISFLLFTSPFFFFPCCFSFPPNFFLSLYLFAHIFPLFSSLSCFI